MERPYDEEIDDGRSQENEEEFGRSPSVEEDTRSENDIVLPDPGRHMVHQEEYRQKIKQEYAAAKDHAAK